MVIKLRRHGCHGDAHRGCYFRYVFIYLDEVLVCRLFSSRFSLNVRCLFVVDKHRLISAIIDYSNFLFLLLFGQNCGVHRGVGDVHPSDFAGTLVGVMYCYLKIYIYVCVCLCVC